MLGTLVVPALTLSLASGCDDTRAAASDLLPLPKIALPKLWCTEPAEVLGECQRAADCGAGELCRLDPRSEQIDRGPIALACGAALGTLEARARCESSDDCQTGLCSLTGVCLDACSEGDDCPTGQSCQPVEARIGDDGLAPVNACARVAAFAPDVELRVLEPGTLTAGRLNRVPLELSTNDTLALLKADCGRTLRIQRMTSRDDERSLFDIASLLNGEVQINPVLNEGALVPLLIPNNPTAALSSAGYDLGVTVDADTPLTIVTARGTKRHTRLAINLFYAGGGTMLEVGGIHPGDARLDEVLARLRARYEAIGIELAAINEYDVVGVLRDQLSTMKVRQTRDAAGNIVQRVEGLDRVFALSAGTDDAGLNVFLVRSMEAVLGISGGIPGALGTHGTPASGVAVALDEVPLDQLDHAIFHELSHQMGLFHLVESDGLVLDPLPDTALCSLQRDDNGDGILRSSECTERGADNVMFWEGEGESLSTLQIELLRRSLALH